MTSMTQRDAELREESRYSPKNMKLLGVNHAWSATKRRQARKKTQIRAKIQARKVKGTNKTIAIGPVKRFFFSRRDYRKLLRAASISVPPKEMNEASITTENALLKAENKGFKTALYHKKKKRKRGKQLFEVLPEQAEPMEGYPQEPQGPAPAPGLVTLTTEDLRTLLREARSGEKSMKGPDVPPFNAEGPKVMDKLERFQTGIRMKLEAEEDRYATPRARINYVFSRMEGRAVAMCVVGIQEARYGDWLDMLQELETAFGELDPRYAWDKRLLSMRQENRPFADYINEFRTIAQRTAFRGRALTSLLRYSLSRDLEAKVSTEDVSELEFTALVEVLLRQDHALRAASRQAWGVPRNNQPARSFAAPELASPQRYRQGRGKRLHNSSNRPFKLQSESKRRTLDKQSISNSLKSSRIKGLPLRSQCRQLGG